MIVFCHDCDHMFVEHVDTEADMMECPYCGGGNFDAYPEVDEADPLAYVEDWEDR